LPCVALEVIQCEIGYYILSYIDHCPNKGQLMIVIMMFEEVNNARSISD